MPQLVPAPRSFGAAVAPTIAVRWGRFSSSTMTLAPRSAHMSPAPPARGAVRPPRLDKDSVLTYKGHSWLPFRRTTSKEGAMRRRIYWLLPDLASRRRERADLAQAR